MIDSVRTSLQANTCWQTSTTSNSTVCRNPRHCVLVLVGGACFFTVLTRCEGRWSAQANKET